MMSVKCAQRSTWKASWMRSILMLSESPILVTNHEQMNSAAWKNGCPDANL